MRTNHTPFGARSQAVHAELVQMSSAALWRELVLVSLQLALDKRRNRLRVEREARLREELRSRGYPPCPARERQE